MGAIWAGPEKEENAQRFGISYSAVREYILHAERRFCEYEDYCAAKARGQEAVVLPLT